MELKSKYQYTYFIYPYIIDQYKYTKYILNLLNNKKIKIKCIEKEKDLEIYNYFLPNIKKYMFGDFEITKNKINHIKELNKNMQAKILSQYDCIMFEYELEQSMQGKAENEKCLFFEIPKIEIICFNTGICFLNIKTNIEGSNNFSDILDFNYKFRDLNSENNNLKNYENINIQSSTFKDIETISDIIKNITGHKENLKKLNMQEDKVFTYAYTCLEEIPDKENETEIIKKEYTKYISLKPSLYNSNNLRYEEGIQKNNYVKIGASNLGIGLLTTTKEIENYTKLPHSFENEYLYTYIIALYKKIYLQITQYQLEKTKNPFNILKKIDKFIKKIELSEITEDEFGKEFYKYTQEKIGYNETYKRIKDWRQIIKQNKAYKKVKTRDKILKIVILILAIINIILLWKLKQ